jgi:hypothetical protein
MFGSRSQPLVGRCERCGFEEELSKLDAENECELCQAIRSLRICMEEKGTIKQREFDRLPPGDR